MAAYSSPEPKHATRPDYSEYWGSISKQEVLSRIQRVRGGQPECPDAER